ncbi:tetratricopeptide repeat protein [Nocardia wallacei]|uniref:tetratricopeptide repeat protein n=1 Tax=Nocardia wallacei TaxID=480035 RepID=UPI0024566499|nr:tetratricopeptide repeat protein [Nocardia wallacei]
MDRLLDYDHATAAGADLQQQALALYRELGDRRGQADTLTNLGLVHMWTWNHAEATNLQLQALALFRELPRVLGRLGVATTSTPEEFVELTPPSRCVPERRVAVSATFTASLLAVCREVWSANVARDLGRRGSDAGSDRCQSPK